MDRFTRILLMHRLLSRARRPLSRRYLEEQLECSAASVKRVIAEMRDYLGAPIVYDRDANGYYYAADASALELPGLWFSADELMALASTQALLARMSPGLLGSALRPARERVEQLLASDSLQLSELPRRVRLLALAERPPEPTAFRRAAAATLQRRRLSVRYHARADDARRERELSPQRLILYRHNWYLDAWCHLREGLRTFALERLESVRVLREAALELPEAQLEAHYAAGYGLFAGPVTAVAVLRFEPTAARWVSEERWHPRQENEWLADGRYELRLPYSDSRELVMDVLRYGPEVEVVGPRQLREEVRGRLEAALRRYSGPGSASETVAVLEPNKPSNSQ